MRKHLLLCLLIGFSTLTLVASEAEAKRLGGGKSFGRTAQPVQQRQTAEQPKDSAQQPGTAQQQNTTQQAAASKATPGAKQPNRLLGALGGIAAAVGLAALLSHFGLAGAAAEFIGSLLLILGAVAIAVFLWRKLRGGQSTPRPAYAGMGQPPQTTPPPQTAPARPLPVQRDTVKPTTTTVPASSAGNTGFVSAAASFSGADDNRAPPAIPADMDVDNFLHYSKVHFVRLQASWDSGNLEDIREFTTPAMFAELKLQLNERDTDNFTDVVSVEAELLGVVTAGTEDIASVRFSGQIREAKDAPVEDFVEVWNLTRPSNRKTGWLLAGIEQVSQ